MSENGLSQNLNVHLSSHSILTFCHIHSITFYFIPSEYLYNRYTYHRINIAILGCTNPQVAPKCDLFSTKHTTHSGVHASASSWHSRPRISGCFLAANRSVQKTLQCPQIATLNPIGGCEEGLVSQPKVSQPPTGPQRPEEV